MALLGPFAQTLRESNFTDSTAGSGVTSTATYTPLASFRIPLNQAFEFLPSTQFTAQQQYWAQALQQTTSAAAPAASGTGIRLERRDASGNLILDIIDWGSYADIASLTNSQQNVYRRYFTHRTVLFQDEYLYLSVQATASTTPISPIVGTGTNQGQILIRCQYWVKA